MTITAQYLNWCDLLGETAHIALHRYEDSRGSCLWLRIDTLWFGLEDRGYGASQVTTWTELIGLKPKFHYAPRVAFAVHPSVRLVIQQILDATTTPNGWYDMPHRYWADWLAEVLHRQKAIYAYAR